MTSEKPELIQFRKQDAAIAELVAKYGNLRINGLDDKKGFADVHEARMIVKNTRVAIEKKRNELMADALECARKVDEEANRLFAMLEPIESHLEAEAVEVMTDEAFAGHLAIVKADYDLRINVERIAAENRRLEKARPHRERIVSVANAVDAIQVLEGPLSADVCKVLQTAAREIRQIAWRKI
ncbi:MAG: hypothetical protein L0Z50_20955 [Verrucomicrobiales bacterium]|nr:hypothetical protein [Verrucomicrobiales bacterium]